MASSLPPYCPPCYPLRLPACRSFAFPSDGIQFALADSDSAATIGFLEVLKEFAGKLLPQVGMQVAEVAFCVGGATRDGRVVSPDSCMHGRLRI